MQDVVKYKQTITAVTVHLDGESPVFGESTITVALDDEAGGIFLVLTDGEGVKMKVDYEQWVEINKAVKKMMKQNCEGI